VVASESNGKAALFIAGAAGALGPRQDLAAGVQPVAAVLGDLDEDGWRDVAVACRNLGDEPYLTVRLQIPPAPDPADVNGDGLVNVNDLVAVILAWGPCPAPPAACAADVDGNGAVNVNDLVAVIVAWTP
jgi:hypothetical protein